MAVALSRPTREVGARSNDMRHWLAAAALGLLSGIAATAAAQQPPAAPKPPAADEKKTEPAAKTAPDFNIDLNEPDDPPAAKQAPKGPAAPKATPSFELEADEDAPPVKTVAKNSYTGVAECVRCHEKQAKPYREGPHGRTFDERTPAAGIGCETCHGPGRAHDVEPGAKGLIVGFKTTTPREVTKVCLTCHDNKSHTNWQGGTHAARNISCASCHSVHGAKSEGGLLKTVDVVSSCAQCHRDKAAKMQRAAHMPVMEGKMDCASCHNEHGSKGGGRLLRAGSTVNELCDTCHAEKRGPFLWDHTPVRENCTTCHDPHGSSNNRMLVAKAPMLCQRCHIATRHPATPYDGVALIGQSNRLVGRSCATCHPAIHGSNHPSGQYFMR
jgi:DmsE family decaheme c-type cytochrome